MKNNTNAAKESCASPSTPGPDMKHGPGPGLMGAHTLIGNNVYNLEAEDLGDIKDIMLDMSSGSIGYAALSCGSFLGMNEKLFAVPWQALTLDTENKRFTLNVGKERIEQAPGFDKGHWPGMADQAWAKEVHAFYGMTPSTTATLHL